MKCRPLEDHWRTVGGLLRDSWRTAGGSIGDNKGTIGAQLEDNRVTNRGQFHELQKSGSDIHVEARDLKVLVLKNSIYQSAFIFVACILLEISQLLPLRDDEDEFGKLLHRASLIKIISFYILALSGYFRSKIQQLKNCTKISHFRQEKD